MNLQELIENEFGWLLNPEKMDSNDLRMVIDSPALYRDIEKFLSKTVLNNILEFIEGEKKKADKFVPFQKIHHLEALQLIADYIAEALK